MKKDLKTNSVEISKINTLTCRVSECVAVGFIEKTTNIYGLTHIHYKNNHINLLNSLFSNIKNKSKLEIIVCGGVNSFIPYFGFIPGEDNANRVIDYLNENNLDKNIILMDIYTNYIRELTLNKKLGYKLKKIENK